MAPRGWRLPSGGRAAAVLAAASVLSLAMAFKEHEFRYCKDSSFCRRQRKNDGSNTQHTFKLGGVSMQPVEALFEVMKGFEPSVSACARARAVPPLARYRRRLPPS